MEDTSPPIAEVPEADDVLFGAYTEVETPAVTLELVGYVTLIDVKTGGTTVEVTSPDVFTEDEDEE